MIVIFAAFIFAVPVLYAAEFPTGAQTEILDDFSGGLNTTIASHKVDRRFSPFMKNVFIHRKPRTIITRKGFTLLGSTNTLSDGRFIFLFNKENGAKEFIVSDGSRVLSTQDFVAYTFISSAMNNSVGLDCAQVRNKVWCTNSIDSVFTWDGTDKQILDGKNNLPNVPKARYIDFWQERVWLFNTSANGSLLQFSSLISTDNVAIAPDNSRAWPVTNGLNIGQGDGQIGTSLWIYNGRLYCGKDRSIWVIFGDNSSNYRPVNIESQVGVISNDSVSVLDGFTYLKGIDGVYQFNGSRVERVSDLITPDMDAVNNSVNRTLTNVWDTSSDFTTKGNFQGSTVTVDGLVQMQQNNRFLNSVSVSTIPASSNFLTLTESNQFSPWAVIVPSISVPDTSLFFLKEVRIWHRARVGTPNIGITIRNPRTNKSATIANTISGSAFGLYDPSFTDESVVFSSDDISNGNFQIQVASNTPFAANAIYDFYPTSDVTNNSATIIVAPAKITQYTSEITTLTSVTAWGNFDSNYTSNQGTITYYIRSATSIVNISTQVWSGISPGVIINAPTINNYIQWATTITAVSSNTPSNIDNVTISHVEGGSNRDRPFSAVWNKEYWISISTGVNSTSIQYVKSWITNATNSNAWNRMYNMDIRSFAVDGNSTFYGGSASTGSFYRLDYGTNDDGRAIDAYYETPDMTLGSNFTDKQLYEVWIDADRQAGNTFTLGVSTNGGAFGNLTASLDGTGRKIHQFKTLKSFGNTFRFRLQNNQLDKSLNFHSLAVIYTPSLIRSIRD